MNCPNCSAENISSAKFCKHCGEKLLPGQNQVAQNAQGKPLPSRRNKTVLLAIGIIMLILLVASGYFISRGDKIIEDKSATDNTTLNRNQQTTSDNDIVENNGSPPDDHVAERLASFNSFAVSVNPAVMTCADEGQLAAASDAPGDAICEDVAIKAGSFPTLQAGTCDGNSYTVATKDAIAADGQYSVTMTCTIAGTALQVACNRNGCATPSLVGFIFQVGVSYYKAGQYDKAQSQLEQAVELADNYSNARFFLGLVYDKQNKKQKALEQFQKVSDLNPDNQNKPEVKKIISNLQAGKKALDGLSLTWLNTIIGSQNPVPPETPVQSPSQTQSSNQNSSP